MGEGEIVIIEDTNNCRTCKNGDMPNIKCQTCKPMLAFTNYEPIIIKKIQWWKKLWVKIKTTILQQVSPQKFLH